MSMVDTISPNNDLLVFSMIRTALLGITGGSNHPIGTYSRRSELVSGTTRNGWVGIMSDWYHVGVDAISCVDFLLLFFWKALTARIRSTTFSMDFNSAGLAS